jgi:hypothetical protein
MPPQTPLVLLDNVFDTIGLYAGAALTTSSESVGRDAFRIADYRRDRTYWSPTTDGGGVDHWVRVQLVAAHGVDYIVLDRGHNLAGKTVYIEGSSDGATWSISQALNVPAASVVGGTPTAPAMAATEEGAAWTIIPAALAARVWWRLRVPYTAAFIPIVTGVMAGLKTQLLNFSTSFDEDAGGRTQASQQSIAGYRATDTTYAWRTVKLGLKYIGATEYDATIRTLRETIFAKNQPWMCFLDYGTRPERGWLYEFDGTDWAMAKQRVLREGVISGREVGAKLG